MSLPLILEMRLSSPKPHPNITTYIFHTMLSTFHKVLTRRILAGDHFLYSHDLNV